MSACISFVGRTCVCTVLAFEFEVFANYIDQ